MAVQFIVGSAGTGKTRYIYDKMISESMKENHPPIIFILPEQSNMGAEKDMITLHPHGGTMDISILSFTRLAFQVFDKDNIYTADILDDYGKSMIIMKVLREHADELLYYGNMVGRQGFVDEVKSILSEFYQYRITVDRLEEIISNMNEDNSLFHKLSDIRIIMKNFEKEMGNTYMVSEQMLSLLAEHIGESEMLADAQVYFDGFTGFTPIQYEVISKMMTCCGDLYFTVTMDEHIMGDNSYNEPGLFSMGKDTIARITGIAEDMGVCVKPHVKCAEQYRFADNGMLSHVEKNIFRFPVKEYDGDYDMCNDDVKVVSCGNIEDELLYIGREIQHMVRDDGYRYRDIAVITGDLEDNFEQWKRIMEQLEIPYFLDVNEPLVHNQIVEFVSLFFRLFESDFSYDSVFSFLKTGFMRIGMKRIYELENYALKYGVRGYSWWNNSFKGSYKGLSNINKTRQEFMEAINEVYQIMSKPEGKTVEYIEALYKFIKRFEFEKTLREWSLRLEELGNVRQAKVYDKAYEKLIMVLDKTVDIMGDETVSRKTLSDMLLIGLSDMKLGILPNTLDQVLIGDTERTRLHHVKILFIAGANEGILPGAALNGGIITESDRNKLKALDVELSPNNMETYYIQQFYLYMQMTQASDRLIISYRRSDNRGNVLNRSFFVKYIMQMFSDKETFDGNLLASESLPKTEQDMFYELSNSMSEDKLEDSSLYLLISEVNKDGLDNLTGGYLYMNQPGKINEAIARKLYGNSMVHTVSKLESYAGCQFKFFLQYGLMLNKPEEYKVESSNIGSILHKVMEEFFKFMKNEGVEFNKEDLEKAGMTEDFINEKVKEITILAANGFNDTIFESSYRYKNQLDVIIRIAQRSVNNLMRHLEEGKLMPEYFEKYFSPEDNLQYIHMQLDDDIVMDMRGVIDRVDIKETEDSVYVKVIDYKSGNKDIDFSEVAEGRQLQLAVYMSVVVELLQKRYPDKKIIPAGMYYYQMADKIVSGNDDDEIEENRIKESRMSGLVNKDDKCLEYMDNSSGRVTPVNYTKSGLSATNPHLVTGKELLALSDYTRNKMIELGNEIIHGQIDMTPQKGVASTCDFCDYRSVCRFEAGLGGNNYSTGNRYGKNEARDIVVGSTASKSESDKNEHLNTDANDESVSGN